jgi:four helix bundle protein
MKAEDLKNRTMDFAVRVMNMASALPKEGLSRIIAEEVIRSASRAGASYHSACKAGSRRGFVSKLKIVEQQMEESGFWLGLIEETKVFSSDRIALLVKENNELLAIIAKSIRTANENLKTQSAAKKKPE